VPGNPSALTAKEASEINDLLKGLSPGEPQSCIQQTRVTQSHAFTNTILYEYSPREIYRVTTTPGCTGLRYGDIIVSRTPSGNLCRGDIIRTVSPGSSIPSGSCALGDFIPYRR
jgi:hypothetical protein